MSITVLEYSELTELLSSPRFPHVFSSSLHSPYDVIKVTNAILSTLCDFEEEYDSSLSEFKQACFLIQSYSIKPLILKDKSSFEEAKRSEILAKWWQSYINLLAQAYEQTEDREGWGSRDVNEWFTDKDSELLQASFQALEEKLHWKILLTKVCVCNSTLLQSFYKNNDSLPLQIAESRSYLLSFLEKELNILRLSLHKRPDDEKSRYLFENLSEISEFLQQNAGNSAHLAVFNGRLDKKLAKNLQHSVIFGDDGGLYLLLNSLCEREKLLFLETGELSAEYLSSFPVNSEKNTYKIVIGKGSFGTIRLALPLTRNESESSATLRPGQLICVKKTSHNREKIKNRQGKVLKRLLCKKFAVAAGMTTPQEISANWCFLQRSTI